MFRFIVAAAVTILAAFGAAWFGAGLQRKWTPNPIPTIERLGERIKELRQRLEAVEQERMDAASFTLGIRLTEGHINYYLLLATNDGDKDVSIETMQLFLGEAPLCGPERPEPTDNWLIPGRSRKQLKLSPETDPIMTLKSTGVAPQHFAVPYRIVLTCRCDGKPRTAQQTLLLTYRDNRLTQFGP